MKKNPALWIGLATLVVVVAYVVIDTVVPKKVVIGGQTGKVGRFVKETDPEILPMVEDAAVKTVDNDIEDMA